MFFQKIKVPKSPKWIKKLLKWVNIEFISGQNFSIFGRSLSRQGRAQRTKFLLEISVWTVVLNTKIFSLSFGQWFFHQSKSWRIRNGFIHGAIGIFIQISRNSSTNCQYLEKNVFKREIPTGTTFHCWVRDDRTTGPAWFIITSGLTPEFVKFA